MIKVRHLRKEYGELVAVDDVSFELQPGEILGFLGPNGAGKSTTMKMLTGFLGPTSGQVRIWDSDLAEDRLAAQARIGYLPEGAPCYEEMNPRSFLHFVGEARGLKGRALADAFARVVQVLSLEKVLGQKIETLSKGFKRRVGLAQAILHDPDLLILDEPTDGLDPNQKHQVREMIKGLSKDKIVIISTHILEEVTAVCNRVMVLAAGRIVEDTTPRGLQAKSRYQGAVTVVLPEDAGEEALQRAEQALAGVPGITSVEVGDGSLTVFGQFASQPTSLSQTVASCLEQQGIAVESLMVEQGRLDDVFRELTEGAQQ